MAKNGSLFSLCTFVSFVRIFCCVVILNLPFFVFWFAYVHWNKNPSCARQAGKCVLVVGNQWMKRHQQQQHQQQQQHRLTGETNRRWMSELLMPMLLLLLLLRWTQFVIKIDWQSLFKTRVTHTNTFCPFSLVAAVPEESGTRHIIDNRNSICFSSSAAIAAHDSLSLLLGCCTKCDIEPSSFTHGLPQWHGHLVLVWKQYQQQQQQQQQQLQCSHFSAIAASLAGNQSTAVGGSSSSSNCPFSPNVGKSANIHTHTNWVWG